MRAVLISTAIFMAAISAAGCGRAEAGSDTGRTGSSTMRVRAVNYALTAPTTVRAGLVRVRMDNHGTELHHTQLVRLDSGRTFADLQALLRQPWGPMPGWVRHVGGPGAVIPGDSSEVMVMLTPGNYAMLCYVPDEKGVPHFTHGMVRAFTVLPAETPNAAPPTPDLVMVLDNYRFDLSGALRAGRQTIEVTNAASQWHEVVFLRMQPGKGGADFARWEMEGRQGPPPGRPIGGPVGLDNGERNWFTVDLEPGSYSLVCFYPDRGDGRPHLAHGMIKDFVVQ